jgi:hypothetical protein
VNRRRWIYPSGLTFFTLPLDYRIQLHSQIWEMVQFSNGFTWSEVYHMPVYLRRFYFNKLVEMKKKEAEEMKKAQSKSKVRMR